jgi:hypothetical protein
MSRREAEAKLRAAQEMFTAEIRRVYSDAERRMLEKVTRRIERGIDTSVPGWAERKLAEITALNKEIGVELRDLRKLDPKIEAAVKAAYDAGAGVAAADLVAANMTNAAIGGLVRGAAVKTLAAATIGALDGTQLRILRSAQDAYRGVISEASAQVLTGVVTRRQAAQIALDRFADQGVSGFVDSAGRSWDLASYTEMAVRSATGQAAVQGHIDKLAANDRDLVIVSDNPDECEKCRPWEGQVLSVTGRTPGYPTVAEAREAGLFHPNCRHGLGIWIEGLTRPMKDTADPVGYAERQQQRHNERMIRRWKNREAVAITDQAKRRAAAKIGFWQATQRDFIARTGRRRDYGRESVTRAR